MTKEPKVLSSDSPVEDGKRILFQRDLLGAPVLIYMVPRKKVCKRSKEDCQEETSED